MLRRAQLARSKAHYPSHTSSEGVLLVRFRPANEEILVVRPGSEDNAAERFGDTGRFAAMIEDAYRFAIDVLKKPDEIDPGLSFEVPWTFELR